ncbi:hypothetical protein GCM10009584_07960 [Ornithinimicrobium humiphilum]
MADLVQAGQPGVGARHRRGVEPGDLQRQRRDQEHLAQRPETPSGAGLRPGRGGQGVRSWRARAAVSTARATAVVASWLKTLGMM